MENVTLDVVYKHILQIEKRLDNLEDILDIPEIKVSDSQLKKYKQVLKKMMQGKEGISLEDYKRSRS